MSQDQQQILPNKLLFLSLGNEEELEELEKYVEKKQFVLYVTTGQTVELVFGYEYETKRRLKIKLETEDPPENTIKSLRILDDWIPYTQKKDVLTTFWTSQERMYAGLKYLMEHFLKHFPNLKTYLEIYSNDVIEKKEIQELMRSSRVPIVSYYDSGQVETEMDEVKRMMREYEDVNVGYTKLSFYQITRLLDVFLKKKKREKCVRLRFYNTHGIDMPTCFRKLGLTWTDIIGMTERTCNKRFRLRLENGKVAVIEHKGRGFEFLLL
uniref:FTH domain-containing protein n=1 Tax=Caenorhabditis tropicalis TaxID=1561998 RepID=A0A1I7UTS6_9PELO